MEPLNDELTDGFVYPSSGVVVLSVTSDCYNNKPRTIGDIIYRRRPQFHRIFTNLQLRMHRSAINTFPSIRKQNKS